jgi:hypothetical protein
LYVGYKLLYNLATILSTNHCYTGGRVTWRRQRT